MKINHIKYDSKAQFNDFLSLNCANKHYPSFKAGVINLYSDFDGTFIPHEYRHDTFCNNNPESPRQDFLKNGKEKFKEYFESFKELMRRAKGQNGDKLNFTITTGRNRSEYNYFIKKIRDDNLSIPVPDKLTVRNGGDCYLKRKDVDDFFRSDVNELFLKNDFVQEKRDAVKIASNGWDGDQFKEIIKHTIGEMVIEDKQENVLELLKYIVDSFPDTENVLEKATQIYDEIMKSKMKKDEIRVYIQNLATDLKNKVKTDPELEKVMGSPDDIDWNIGIFADKLNKIKRNKIYVFEADTDGFFYEYGMHFKDKLDSLIYPPRDYAAMKDNGNLEFCIKFPSHIGNRLTLEEIEKTIKEKLEKNGALIRSKIHCAKNEFDFGEIMFSPLIDGEKINKVFDTKEEVRKIKEGNLNDLVIAAGDEKNDVRMLNLFEYLDDNPGVIIFNAEKLKEIYKLPVISIFVDNSNLKEVEEIQCGAFTVPYKKIDNYFNSDGNVRFIHVLPGNTEGKPQNLQEGIKIAIKEYAKRNEKFRKNLPPELQEIIKNYSYEYPIDKSVSEKLEAQFGQKLWQSADTLKNDIKNNK